MDKQLRTLRNIANERTWASFLNDNHPYSLLHWSIAGVGQESKDVWLLQDEVTFQTTEFPTLDDAIKWISENMEQVTDVLIKQAYASLFLFLLHMSLKLINGCFILFFIFVIRASVCAVFCNIKLFIVFLRFIERFRHIS